MTRDGRQDISTQRIVASGVKGTLEAATAYGKTRVGLNIIKLLRRNDRSRTVIVVVPTLQLKEQWESILREAGQLEYSTVMVINSLILLRNVQCSLLVLDEIHRYAANTFSRVFAVVQYSFICGLTATMKRLDGKHTLLMEKCPIVDTVSMQECRRNGWVSEFTEYNLGIEMTEDEKEEYADLKSQFQAMFEKFNHDFELLKLCSFGSKPKRFGQNIVAPKVYHLALELGWTGNSPEQAYRNLAENASRERGNRLSVWGGDHHMYTPDRLAGFAINGMRLIRVMKDFVHKAPSKVDAALKLIERFNCKTITFGELIETADFLQESLGNSCVVYHSKVKAKIIDGTKVAGAKLKRDALDKIKNDPNTKVIATAKALDQGFDYPGAELGLILSRTSNPTQRTQRIGRVVRLFVFPDGRIKTGVIVNIYLKDTKDLSWLKASQKNERGLGIYWVDSVDEIIEAEFETEFVGVNE